MNKLREETVFSHLLFLSGQTVKATHWDPTEKCNTCMNYFTEIKENVFNTDCLQFEEHIKEDGENEIWLASDNNEIPREALLRPKQYSNFDMDIPHAEKATAVHGVCAIFPLKITAFTEACKLPFREMCFAMK